MYYIISGVTRNSQISLRRGSVFKKENTQVGVVLKKENAQVVYWLSNLTVGNNLNTHSKAALYSCCLRVLSSVVV